MAKFQYQDKSRRHAPVRVVFHDDKDTKGKEVERPWAVFEDGIFETDDEKIADRLRSAENVTEVTDEAPAAETEDPATQTA